MTTLERQASSTPGFHSIRLPATLAWHGTTLVTTKVITTWDTNGIPNDDTLIYATVSKDGGSTFLPNHRISAGASNYAPANSIVDYGDYSGFTFYGGNFYFAAADNSNSTGDNPDGKLSTFDVYVAPVKVR